MLWADRPTKRLNNRIIVLIDFILITLNIKHYYRIPKFKRKKKGKKLSSLQFTQRSQFGGEGSNPKICKVFFK
jgi:hypothetical protein